MNRPIVRPSWRLVLGVVVMMLLVWAPPCPAGDGALSPDRVKALAVNDLTVVNGGYELNHPRHRAVFWDEGVEVSPLGGGPSWTWRLVRVGSADSALSFVAEIPVQPSRPEALVVRYDRIALDEEYVLGAAAIEQRFVIHRPLPLDGRDLVLEGSVSCDGAFRLSPQGWEWRGDGGRVWLGPAVVFDATGEVLPSEFSVTEQSTRLVVDGEALSHAVYPVMIDPEIGANDFRISSMGPDGSSSYDAICPSVAFNETENEYLVVWQGGDDVDGLVLGEYEIFGQILDADGGGILVDDFRISDVGDTGVASYDAMDPDVVWNSVHNQYLVVWDADDPREGMTDDEFEIFGQILDANGVELGANDFRISHMGSNGEHEFDGRFPAVAFNPSNEEYLVVWHGDTNTTGNGDDEFEIWGRGVGSDGALVGLQFQASHMGPAGSTDHIGLIPEVTHNDDDNQFLVIWRGNGAGHGLAPGEFEIFGQIFDAAGSQILPGDVRISDAGGSGDSNFHVDYPAVVYNPLVHEYLVVWSGVDDVGGQTAEDEVFVQRLSADLTEVGANDHRVSDMGGIGIYSHYIRQGLDVALNGLTGEYAIVWAGNDNIDGVVNGEYEVYSQILTQDGLEIGINDARLSDIGGSGIQAYGAHLYLPVGVAANSSTGEFLAVWSADDPDAGSVDEEFEIFGQLWFRTEILIDGFESGNTSAWAATVN